MAAQSGPVLHGDDMKKMNSGLEEDTQDQIRSNGSTPTPTGIATPEPDLVDKRLPSIMHNYFQVGSFSGDKASLPRLWSCLSKPSENLQTNAHTQHSSDSSESFVMMEQEDGPDKMEEENPSLHTPPHSLLQHESDEMELGTSPGVSSIFTTLKNYLISPTQTPPEDPSSRRQTSLPVSSISDDPVLATHFSNPSLLPISDASPLSEGSLLDHEKPHVSISSENLAKLTENAPDGSRLKNTPPLTPRAMSNEVPNAQKKTATSAPQNLSQEAPRSESKPEDLESSTDEITMKLDEAFPSQPQSATASVAAKSASPANGAPTGPINGKLFVKITDGRGLRPSFDPYVVCVFEWNEYISKGARDGEEEKKRRQLESDAEEAAGRPMAIPLKTRSSSHNSASEGDHKGRTPVTDPHWDHEATFDVMGDQSELDVTVYDRNNQEAFLGHVRLCINLKEDHSRLEGWFPLVARGAGDNQVSGEIHLDMKFEKTDRKQVGPNDFLVLKLIGKGTFGQVYQVKKKDTQRIYAMKVLSKKVIIQKKEVIHTLGERNILVRTAMTASPFIVGLKFSFQTPTDLYLVTDYMSGGELFWHLQREGRFQEARAKFYIAELILALQHLHDHDIVYRDLKPENILLDANGHIALCDFGLSKANLSQNDTTNTFCGTTEYLAPEVLLDEQGYTKMVDFWSLGVLVFEMCCGWSPFYAEDTQQMYKNIAFGKVRFPRDALSTEGRNFVKGLLNRNPKHRLGANGDAKELMAHPFFHDINWDTLCRKQVIPPFKPQLQSETDTSNFDPEFTNAMELNHSLNLRAANLANSLMPASTPLSPGMQANFKGFTFVNESSIDHHLIDESDLMEEDTMHDDHWQRGHQSVNSVDQRMTGVQKAHDGTEPGIFNVDDTFDM
ncbi:CAMP-dependent protein kinase-like, putative [Penicillium digitatum PHI26]|uniref:non-specific serine/threonine protein kinase n=2 Tax=Penicillium digitatum TaxID=36651 RepID=K9FJI8_PEND2|nr:CAMP-dependent protein kinase-like, putative [Penicillium digitatum Pd1]EKV08242.1 CAMP-dependent protein kinase-like, putative [Penicillium digitatum Pd1]EKV09745.1 CAMP-dependent protein kinase-like, putative [Penicillium digitatum PHI26]